MTTFKDAITVMKSKVKQVKSIYMSGQVTKLEPEALTKRDIHEDTPDIAEEEPTEIQQILMVVAILVSITSKPRFSPIGEMHQHT